jgi:hypothetical protein
MLLESLISHIRLLAASIKTIHSGFLIAFPHCNYSLWIGERERNTRLHIEMVPHMHNCDKVLEKLLTAT